MENLPLYERMKQQDLIKARRRGTCGLGRTSLKFRIYFFREDAKPEPL
jgi:hypothetical protein